MIHTTDVDTTAQPGFLDLTLGIETCTIEDTGRLGNHNVIGIVSTDLFDFGEAFPPWLMMNHLDGYAMTVTDGPLSGDWQLNTVFQGAEGEGVQVDTTAVAVATLRFYIRNPGGWGMVDFASLQQMYTDDNITSVIVAYDTTGGHARLIPEDTGVLPSCSLPEEFALLQNYPNPFNPTTVITYRVPAPCEVVLCIMNLMGEEIRIIVLPDQKPGKHTTVWDGLDHTGSRVPSGEYFVQMRAGPYTEIRKMILLR